MRVFKKDSFLSIVNNALVDYPTPVNINYFWNYGVLSAFFLGIQIITGVFLAMHYVPSVEQAFNSVEHIMRDVQYGWLIRYFHSNGASFFFILVYLHMLRGLYYGSYVYPTHRVWYIGVTIYIVMMATAFLGYVLPWGQMSLWGATVITNFFSVIPFLGKDVVSWIWGGFSVNNATLNRFFSLHYLLPFVIVALSILHLAALHEHGSKNPLGLKTQSDGIDKVSFHPYFSVKDVFGVFVVLLFFSGIVFFYPNLLGHHDNYTIANPMVTPSHIVPEWYLLPFYAILRSIPSKAGGIAAMALAIISLYLLPSLTPLKNSSGLFRPFYRILFWLFLFNFLILGWIGSQPVEPPFYKIGQLSTCLHFLLLFLAIPGVNFLEELLKYPYFCAKKQN